LNCSMSSSVLSFAMMAFLSVGARQRPGAGLPEAGCVLALR
jgi:hypothetical protein